MESASFRATDTSHYRGVVAHALWAIFLSQWTQNVAAELLAEAESAWSGSKAGDEGKLMWLPDSLLQGIKDIGEVTILVVTSIRIGSSESSYRRFRGCYGTLSTRNR